MVENSVPKSFTQVTAEAAGTLYNKNGHKLDGNANWARTYKQPGVGTGPVTVGGGLQYSREGKGHVGVNAQHTRGFGTDVGANAGVNLFRANNGRTSLDADAFASKHFGGAFGTGRTNYGGAVNFRHRF
ncbi:uncharacterized protein LOC113388590 [Ctenocephalides felis]|uniref:uncharacterized protein LOC113388590 n=1 Tax=Ctenocephalides felis TaxID=7515 RepID=UPI000E6E193F|nr:uncharacterized protein LOC113388590 [Ctenocephalides felis]